MKLKSRITLLQKLRHPIGWLRVRGGMRRLQHELESEL